MYRPYLFSKKNYPLSGLESYLGESCSVARQLSKTHTKAFKVRRSSDNATLDIRFTSKGELDTNTLLNFVGTSSGYINQLYGVNGNVFTNDNSSKEPRIVNNGILDRDLDTNKLNIRFPNWFNGGLNIINQGNFSNTDLWNDLGNCTLTSSNNTGIVTGTGGGLVRCGQETLLPSLVGKRVFLRCKVRVTNSNALNILLRVFDGTAIIAYTLTSPVINQWYTVYGIVTLLNSSGLLKANISVNYTEGTSTGKVMEVQEFLALDVTNYGNPCMVFDGSNDALWCNNSASIDILNQPLYLNSVTNSSIARASSGYVISKNTDASTNIQFSQFKNANDTNTFFIEGTTNISQTSSDTIKQYIQQILSNVWSSNLGKSFVNNVSSGTNLNYSSTITSRNKLVIGARYSTTDTQTGFFQGKISEFHILKGNPKQTEFEQKQMKYYETA
jgi:hypothetical protein